jgi:BirA family biotin operon repressor/biotin-[acetyl-CoA-carboxylase] ligase
MRKIIIGKPLIHLKEVDSTNTFANQLLRKNDTDEGTVILADYQLNGKGQRGNHWESEESSNLLFTIILKPDFLLAERQFFLSMCISIGIAQFIKTISGGAHIKWPNDILLNGRKISGILIENKIMGDVLNTSLVGIGFNVNQTVFPRLLPEPASLKLVTGNTYDLQDLLQKLLEKLSESVNLLYSERFDLIKTEYLNNLWRMNEWASFKDESGRFEGRITDITGVGELLVMKKDGNFRHYGFKEIEFI